MVNKFAIELNNRISKGESYAIVEKNVFSVKVLYILQRNNFIGSFFSINVDKLLVILGFYLLDIMLLIKFIVFRDEVLL